MSKNFSRLLVATLAACATTVADIAKNTNLAQVQFRDYYSTPYSLTGGDTKNESEDAFGGRFSVMGFWEQSLNGSRGSQELAKGYGVSMSRTFEVKPFDVTAATAVTTQVEKVVDVRRLIRVPAGTILAEYTTAEMTLEAKHRRFGVNLEYTQCLSQFYEGLRFRVSTAAIGVCNELVNTYANEIKGTAGAALGSTVKEFFHGTHSAVGTATDAWFQAGLKYGKFTDKSKTEYALNDVQACLSLDIVNTDNATVAVGLSGAIPVGREMKGTEMMEPQVGNRHFKLGAELDLRACLVDGADYKASFCSRAIWHYSFKREGVRLPSHTLEHYGQYYQAYDKDAAVASALEPLVNLVSHKVDVKPGNSFDCSSVLSFEKGFFTADAGYNFHYEQEQKNDVLGFKENSLATVASDFNNTVAGATPRDGKTDAAFVKKTDLNYNAASKATHHIFASVGLVAKDWAYPASVNVIGGYQFAQNRSRTPEVLSVGLKGSLCF